MVTINQNTEMHKLVQTLARMDLPDEVPMSKIEADQRAYDDATALYDMIQQARDILKYARSR
jgi:hypothetical protein